LFLGSSCANHVFGKRLADIDLCCSDIGWVVGHSYILYAPLLAGAATVLLEGKPVGTPDSSTFFRIVDEYKVTTLFTAPSKSCREAFELLLFETPLSVGRAGHITHLGC